MDLPTSLEEWLRNVAVDIFDCDPNADIEKLLLLVGRDIFSLDGETATLDDLFNKIEDNYGRNIRTMKSPYLAAEACLILAVSPAVEFQKLYVKAIMRMDGVHQRNLMQAIENNFEKHLESGVGENTEFLEEICQNCAGFQQIIKQMGKKGEEINQSHFEKESVLRSEIAAHQHRLVDAELALVEKDHQIILLEKQKNELVGQMEVLHKRCNEMKESVSELVKFKDQIDILQPLADRAELHESQNAKLRQKLDELHNVRQQLVEQSEGYSKTHAELLSKEKELEALRNENCQLKKSQGQQAELKIEIQELRLRLCAKESEVTRLSSQIHSVGETHLDDCAEKQQVIEELLAVKEQLREMERVNGVGDGLSELNPRLMEELQKLRSDNATLMSQLDASSLEALGHLRAELDEANCINFSLQQKWMSTKDALDVANKHNASLTAQTAGLRQDLAALEERLLECTRMATEEMRSAKYANGLQLRYNHAQNASRHHLFALGKNAIIDEYCAELSATAAALHHEQDLVKDVNLTNEKLKSGLADALESLKGETLKRRRDAAEATDALRALEEAHVQRLTEEEVRAQSLAAEVDDEKKKRRRIERERRQLEGEAQRLKKQVHLSSGGNAHEVEAALKEFKSMQQQLEEARTEICSLRKMTAAVGGSGSTLVAEGESSLGSEVAGASNRTCNGRSVDSGGNSTGSGVSLARRVRPRAGDQRDRDRDGGEGGAGAFLEQAEFSEKRLDQLLKEKRELIAKSLEENKEKIDLSQRLLQSENEVQALKSKMTKLELEKERAERKLQKMISALPSSDCAENMKPAITLKYSLGI